MAGRFRLFRYELRCWRDGVIPDVDEAVESPQRLTDDPAVARRLLDLVPTVPTLVWGRDDLGAGEMWNSNSVISWLIVRCGLPIAAALAELACGRAPDVDPLRVRRLPDDEKASPHREGSGGEAGKVIFRLRRTPSLEDIVVSPDYGLP